MCAARRPRLLPQALVSSPDASRNYRAFALHSGEHRRINCRLQPRRNWEAANPQRHLAELMKRRNGLLVAWRNPARSRVAVQGVPRRCSQLEETPNRPARATPAPRKIRDRPDFARAGIRRLLWNQAGTGSRPSPGRRIVNVDYVSCWGHAWIRDCVSYPFRIVGNLDHT